MLDIKSELEKVERKAHLLNSPDRKYKMSNFERTYKIAYKYGYTQALKDVIRGKYWLGGIER